MTITTIVRLGVGALVLGMFFGVSLPVRADQLVWVRAQPLNYFKVRGLNSCSVAGLRVGGCGYRLRRTSYLLNNWAGAFRGLLELSSHPRNLVSRNS